MGSRLPCTEQLRVRLSYSPPFKDIMVTQNINGWTLLENEGDEPMIRHATQYNLQSDFSAWHVDWWHELEQDYSFNRRVCLDIGASYGWMSIPFSQNFDSVHCFEPFNPVYQCLKTNISNINVNNITTHNVALGHENITTNLTNKPNTGGNALILQLSDADTDVVEIQMKTLDSFNFTDVDFIKIDTEGSEHFVIRGAVDTIDRCKPQIIIVEIHSHRTDRSKQSRQEVIGTLRHLGYELLDVRKSDFIFKLK